MTMPVNIVIQAPAKFLALILTYGTELKSSNGCNNDSISFFRDML